MNACNLERLKLCDHELNYERDSTMNACNHERITLFNHELKDERYATLHACCIDDVIPHEASWLDETGQCTSVSAGELFYAYAFGADECALVDVWCSLAAQNQKDTSVVSVVRDAGGDVFLIFNHNSYDPSSTASGSARLHVTVEGGTTSDAHVVLFDDRKALNYSKASDWFGDCAQISTDCHSWSSVQGQGYFSWAWVRQHDVLFMIVLGLCGMR